jgi:hypothetical protein
MSEPESGQESYDELRIRCDGLEVQLHHALMECDSYRRRLDFVQVAMKDY